MRSSKFLRLFFSFSPGLSLGLAHVLTLTLALSFAITLTSCGQSQGTETAPSFPEFTATDSASIPLHIGSIDTAHLFEGNVSLADLRPLPKTFNAAVNAPPYQDTLWAFTRFQRSPTERVLIYAGRQGSMALHFYAVIEKDGECLPETVKQLTALDEEEEVAMEAWILDVNRDGLYEILQKESKVTATEARPVAEHLWAANAGKWQGMGAGELDPYPLWCGAGFTQYDPLAVHLPALEEWLMQFARGYRSREFWTVPLRLNGREYDQFPPALQICPSLKLIEVWRHPDWDPMKQLGISVEQKCNSQTVNLQLEIVMQGNHWQVREVRYAESEIPRSGPAAPIPAGKSFYEFVRLHWMQPPGEAGRWERELLQLSLHNEGRTLEGELLYQGTSHSISRWSLMPAAQNANRAGNFHSFYLTPVNENGEELGISKPLFFNCSFTPDRCIVMNDVLFIEAGTEMMKK